MTTTTYNFRLVCDELSLDTKVISLELPMVEIETVDVTDNFAKTYFNAIKSAIEGSGIVQSIYNWIENFINGGNLPFL